VKQSIISWKTVCAGALLVAAVFLFALGYVAFIRFDVR